MSRKKTYHYIRPRVRTVTHCPNCGQAVDEHTTGASILDVLVGNFLPARHHVRKVVERLNGYEWHRDDVPSYNLIVEMARYALLCRGVTGMGINKMATKVAGEVVRRARWRLPPKRDED